MLLTRLWHLLLVFAALKLITVDLAILRLYINDPCSIGNMAVAVWLKRFSCFALCSFGFIRFTTCSFGFILLAAPWLIVHPPRGALAAGDGAEMTAPRRLERRGPLSGKVS